jgi:outer membrane protein OmpA-like peptidoglycan-associated protein
VCTLVATQPGDSNYQEAAPVTVSFSVALLPTISNSALTVVAGTSGNATIPAFSSNVTVTLTTPLGLSAIRTGPNVTITAGTNITGVYVVNVRASSGGLLSLGTITVTVNPQAPGTGTFSPITATKTVVNWGVSPNTSVTGYRVYVNGVLKATTGKVHTVVLPAAYGPKTMVTVIALGNAGTVSTGAALKFKAAKIQPVVGTVYFASGSAALTPSAKAMLKKLALKIRPVGFGQLLLDGYTDIQGNAAYNKKLSAARVAAVQSYLTKLLPKGIKVIPNGHGYLHPVASNGTAAGRAKNRRVTITASK